MVQQLRLCLPLQAVCLPSLVRELRIPWYLWTKNQTIKQKQYGKKFLEDLEKKKKVLAQHCKSTILQLGEKKKDPLLIQACPRLSTSIAPSLDFLCPMLMSSPCLVTAHEPQFSLQTFCCTKCSRRHRFVFPGCTLFFYEGDGRSGIDHNSVPKHAVWVENSIVQAVPEHPKKDFVFCLSNSLGDAFLFQVCGSSFAQRFRSLIRYVPLLLEYFILFSVELGGGGES